MSKRRLTRRQKWRIQKIQEERAERAAQRSGKADQILQEGDLGSEEVGLVISHFGTQIDVETLEGGSNGAIQRCHIRSNIGQLVTGDRVVWRNGNPLGVVVALLPRESVLVRPDNYNQIRPVAANIDQIVIVVAPNPEVKLHLIDRYLVAAEATQIKPVILLNKIDLLDDEQHRQLAAMLSTYQAIGYNLLQASTKTRDGLASLVSQLNSRTSIFVGQSGVGKSSIINALLPDLDLKVGEVSESTGKGVHTTSTARLFHFSAGGNLIDSPGIREFGLWHLEEQQLIEGFIEFRPFLGLCKFRDCKHESEPGCALLDAVYAGKVMECRLESYRIIRASN